MHRALPTLLLLASCGPGPEPKADTCPPGGTDTTWANHGQPFLDTWCSGCHHSALAEELRQGAPLGIDFDTYDGAVAWAERIRVRTVESSTMPPAGGPSEEGRLLLGEWIDCGLPGGGPVPADPCAGGADSLLQGDLVVASASDLDSFCAKNDGVSGDLVVQGSEPVALDCLCEVGGDLRVEGTATEVDLPFLKRVDGSVEAVGVASLDSLLLGDLVEIGGDLRVSGNGGLEQLDVEGLESVGGAVTVAGNDALEVLWLSRLYTVQGGLEVGDNATLASLGLDRLLTVGGALRVEEHPRLTRIFGDLYQLDSVGGDLVIADNPQLAGFYGFEELRIIDGGLRLEGNDSFEDFFGFTQLVSVGGDLVIRDHARLGLVDGFDHLERVDGSVVIGANPVMRFVDGFRVLADVGVGSGGTDGLVLEGLPQLDGIGGLDAVRRTGALTVQQTGLAGLTALHGIESIEGNLTVQDNPGLPEAAVDALVAAVGAENIGGYVVSSGNAP